MTSLLDPVLWLMARRRMRIPGWYQRKKPCMQIREHLPGENAPLFDSIGHIYFTGLANAKKFISVKVTIAGQLEYFWKLLKKVSLLKRRNGA